MKWGINMNLDIKAQWVAALRSGEYSQGRKILANLGPNGETSYCCLGVLCEIAAKNNIVTKTQDDENLWYDQDVVYLPKAVIKWADVPYNGNFPAGDVSKMNDTGKSFNDIAQFIEQNA